MGSTELWKTHHPDADNHSAIWVGLTFLSVVFLHWLLVRYIVSDGLRPSPEPQRLLMAAELGYNQSFFRGTTGLGYFFVVLYCFRVLNGPTATIASLPGPLPTGHLFVGSLLLFLGLVARARGIIVALLQERPGSDLPLPNQALQPTAGVGGRPLES